MQKDVLIIGGGIAGLQAALELAGAGYPVHLITDEPVLGGKLVDAASQTDGDSACVWGEQVNISALYLGGNLHASSSILGSHITRTLNNPLIKVYTGSKLVDFKGEAGRYQATIADVQKADKKQTINAGAVILAAGFSMLDAAKKGEYGYGLYKNVVTSLEFEHLLSASRYRADCIRRPSDGKCASKVAFIQCVGSRDMVSKGDYCSGICCMFTAKEAILAKEFAPATDVTVFYLDVRACGKNFDGFLTRAKELGTNYVRTMISEVKEDPVDENLFISHVAGGKVAKSEFDLVVLATGIRPAARLAETAALLQLPRNEFGFIAVDPLDPVSTGRAGIYSVGGSQGPLDVPETMALASAAAAATARTLGKPDQRPARKPAKEKDINDQPAKVGVFLCKGGLKAMGADVDAVTAAMKKLPDVTVVECEQGLCMPDKLAKLSETVAKTSINRVVVAPCVVRNNLNQFQDAVQNGGLNRMLVSVANVPVKNWLAAPEAATAAAVDSARRAVTDVKAYRPLNWHPETVVPKALIVGGGVSGMTTALALADRGFSSTIVEKEGNLGGYVKSLAGSLEGENLAQTLANLEKSIAKSDKIEVLTTAKVVGFSGHQGHFVSTVAIGDGPTKNTREIEHGVVIIATGTTEYVPAEYLYGTDPRIITATEAQYRIANGKLPGQGEQTYVFIQCVGSRNETHQYCSRTCCSQTVFDALEIKKKNPQADVYVLYRDMRTPGYMETKYREARDAGIIFVHYPEENKPALAKGNDGRLTLNAIDPTSGLTLNLYPELVVLAAAQVATPDAKELADLFKIQVNQDGFLTETHSNFGVIAFPGGGIFLAGAAHGPKSVTECIVQAKGVAGRAARILSQPFLLMGGIVAEVDWEKCAACYTCPRTCPYGIPKVTREKKQMGAAYIEPAECRGCGMCVSECPNKAIKLHHYEDQQVLDRVETALTEVG